MAKKVTEKTKAKIMNNTMGGLSFYDSNGKLIKFSKRGEMKTVAVEDLQELYSTAYKMLDHGCIIILDEDVVEHMGLNYKNVLRYDEIDQFLDETSAEELKKILGKMPSTVQMNVATRAKEIKLDSKSKSKVIKETTGLDVTDVEEEI